MKLPANVVVDLTTAESGDVLTYSAYFPPVEVNSVETPIILYSNETVGSIGETGDVGPPGPVGPSGSPAYTTTASNFDVPAVGASGTVTVVDAAWIIVGQRIYLAGAGNFKVTGKSGNLLTLLNPPPGT